MDAAGSEPIPQRVELDRLPLARRASEMRRELVVARGARRDTLRRAGREVALLAGVDAVLVVGDGPGVSAVAVYERNADRLSMFRPVNREVGRLFGLLLPSPMPGPMDLLPDDEREPPTPWYLKPWALVSLGGGAVLSILGVVVLTSSAIQPDRNGQWDPFP